MPTPSSSAEKPGASPFENRPFGLLLLPGRVRQRIQVHLFSKPEILAWCVALIALELYHLKWIWLTEWNCNRCARKNVDCGCSGRWIKYF